MGAEEVKRRGASAAIRPAVGTYRRNMTDERHEIDLRRRQWVAAVNGADISEYLDLLTDDIVWFPPGQPALSGKEAFETWVGPFMDSFTYQFVIKDPRVTPAGDWAVERGAFETTMTAKSDGKSGSHAGTYLVVWRRTDDGIWRIERYLDEVQIP